MNRDLIREIVKTRILNQDIQGNLLIIPPYREIIKKISEIDGKFDEIRSIKDKYADFLFKNSKELTALSIWIEIGMSNKASYLIESICENWLENMNYDRLEKAILILEENFRSSILNYSLGVILSIRGYHEDAIYYLKISAKMFKKENNLVYEKLSDVYICMTYIESGQISDEINEIIRNIHSCTGIDPILDLKIKHMLGCYHFRNYDVHKALDYFSDVYKYEKLLKNSKIKRICLSNIGSCYLYLGRLQEFLDLFNKIDEFNVTDNINKSIALFKTGDPKKAIECCNIALENARLKKSTIHEILALQVIASIKIKEKNIECADNVIKEALILAKNSQSQKHIGSCIGFQVKILIFSNKIDEARKNHEMMENFIDKNDYNNPFFIELRFLLARAERNFQLARKYRIELQKCADQLNDQSIMDGVDIEESENISRFRVLRYDSLDQPELVIHVLGADKVRFQGREIPESQWQSARARHLFDYLVHTPEGGTREHLLEMIFPGDTGSLAAFNTTLTRLRKALEPDLERGQQSKFLLRSGSRYYFNRQIAFDLDSMRFESLIRRMQSTSGLDAAHAARRLQAANRNG
jgi:tetratricopeptide (TPR) repeat protein